LNRKKEEREEVKKSERERGREVKTKEK